MRPRGVRCRKPCWMRKGLDHVFDRVAFLADRGGDVVEPDRAAVEAVDHGLEQLSVHHVESVRVDVEHHQRLVGERLGDLAAAFHVGVVAHPAQQSVGDARRATRAPRDLEAAGVVEWHLEQAGRAPHDRGELVGRVELQSRDDAEAVAQRIGEHARARRRADQREGLQLELDRARRRAFADHDVDLVVLERGVEDFLDDRREAMDLVDEENVVLLEVGEDRGEVLGLFEHRPRGRAQIHAEARWR